MKKEEFEKGLLFGVFIIMLALLSRLFSRDLELMLLGSFATLCFIWFAYMIFVDEVMVE